MRNELTSIYFGEVRQGPADQPSYVIYHDFFGRGEGGRLIAGFGVERLGGYLEGATAWRWEETRLINGIPDHLVEHFEGDKPQPLEKETLEQVFDDSMKIHYRDLFIS